MLTTGQYVNVYDEKHACDIYVLINEPNEYPTPDDVSQIEECCEAVMRMEFNKTVNGCEWANQLGRSRSGFYYSDKTPLDPDKFIDALSALKLGCLDFGFEVIIVNRKPMQDYGYSKENGRDDYRNRRNLNRYEVGEILDSTDKIFTPAVLKMFTDLGYDRTMLFTDWLDAKVIPDHEIEKDHWNPIRGSKGSLPKESGEYIVSVVNHIGERWTEECFYDDDERWFWISSSGRVTAWEPLGYDDDPYVERPDNSEDDDDE